MLKEDYLISITNQQRQNSESELEEFTLTTTGSYLEKDGKRYIIYQNYDPEDETAQTSTLKIDSTGETKMVSLIRYDKSHQNSTNLILEQGRRHLCQYGTPFGVMTLGVFTSRIEDQLHEEGGSIRMEYTLDVNTNLSSINAITVTVKPAASSALPE